MSQKMKVYKDNMEANRAQICFIEQNMYKTTKELSGILSYEEIPEADLIPLKSVNFQFKGTIEYDSWCNAGRRGQGVIECKARKVLDFNFTMKNKEDFNTVEVLETLHLALIDNADVIIKYEY